MYDTIRLWTGQYRVVRAGSPAAGERIILFDPALTESLVRDAMTDMFSAAVLYEIAARHLFVDRFTYGETEVVRRLVMALCDGRIEIYPVLEAKPEAAPVSAPPKTQPRVLVHTDVKPTSWVRLRVVDAATDAPISGARLRVTLPGNRVRPIATGAHGEAAFRDIFDGSCVVSSDLDHATLDSTLHVEHITSEPAEPPIDDTSGDWTPGEPQYLAQIIDHRVRTGETLDQLARQGGIGAAELAAFNWGTRDDAQIRKHLFNDIGATRLDTDGAQVVFDASDEPGRLAIPKPWRAKGLATEMVHTIRVSTRESREVVGQVWVRLVTIFDHPLPRIDSLLGGGGRRWPERRTSDEGELLWEGLPLDEDYAVTLRLGGRTLVLHVFWAREHLAVHYERVTEAAALLGPPDDPFGIQVRLLGLGHDPGAIDGVIGPRTRGAIEVFQVQHGLVRTGRPEAGVLQILADRYGA